MGTVISIELRKDGHKILSVDDMTPINSHLSDSDKKHYNEMIESLRNDPFCGSKMAIGKNQFLLRKMRFNTENLGKFLFTYAGDLETAMRAFPDQYAADYDTTLRNMCWAIVQGTFNKDSITFRATCKKLGIKHTFKAIDEFIGREK